MDGRRFGDAGFGNFLNRTLALLQGIGHPSRAAGTQHPAALVGLGHLNQLHIKLGNGGLGLGCSLDVQRGPSPPRQPPSPAHHLKRRRETWLWIYGCPWMSLTESPREPERPSSRQSRKEGASSPSASSRLRLSSSRRAGCSTTVMYMAAPAKKAASATVKEPMTFSFMI